MRSTTPQASLTSNILVHAPPPAFHPFPRCIFAGRYNSILLFSVIYLVGLFVAAASCVPGSVSPLLLFPAIYVLALGTGGIKASVSVFGADQFDDNDPADVEEKRSFFNW